VSTPSMPLATSPSEIATLHEHPSVGGQAAIIYIYIYIYICSAGTVDEHRETGWMTRP
jgi:hypothetical protein